MLPLPHEGLSTGYAPRKKRSYFTKRNFVFLTLIYIIILIVVIILLLSVKSCLKFNSESQNPQPDHLSLLDDQNRPCFYKEIRLPKSIIPNYYDIYIHPNITQVNRKSFIGQVSIDSICTSSTDFVVLHAKNLTLYDPQIKIKDQTVKISIISFCSKLDQYYLKFSPFCQMNEKFNIKLSFNGTLEKRLDGFYLSDYKTKAGLDK